MYMETKSMIKMNDMATDLFTCNIGVRQGENLSPFLFLLYINDLDRFLLEKGIVGMKYLKLSILLYADDTVIMTESAYDLQHALNEFEVWCKQLKLNVNVEKRKKKFQRVHCLRIVF